MTGPPKQFKILNYPLRYFLGFTVPVLRDK